MRFLANDAFLFSIEFSYPAFVQSSAGFWELCFLRESGVPSIMK